MGTVELLVTVVGLPAQGKLEGTLRLASAGDKGEVGTTITFLRRRSSWLGLALLAAGVAWPRHFAIRRVAAPA